jgi:hypothetical protein
VIRLPRELPAVEAPDDLGVTAYAHVAELVGFGPRYTGSPGWQRSVDYIARTLRETTGIEPVRDRWTDPEHGVEFENIHLTIPGASRDHILLACHHDTKRCEGHEDPEHNFPFVGANDSGSGVGLLLALAEELARQSRKQRPRATIEIAFFDGEECLEFDWDETVALFGSRRVAARERTRRNQPEQSRVRAMILLDMVGARDLQIDDETNSDRELHDIFAAAARTCGHQKIFFQHRMAIRDDHMPFVEAGIPAIDLIDLIDNPQWHTADDTLEHIAPESLQIVGEVVLTALPAIEDLHFPGPGRLQLPTGSGPARGGG